MIVKEVICKLTQFKPNDEVCFERFEHGHKIISNIEHVRTSVYDDGVLGAILCRQK